MTSKKIAAVCCLSGFDPSAGAGALADIKTLQLAKVPGIAVLSALTSQHDTRFVGVQWRSASEILSEFTVLLERYEISILKVGIVENESTFFSVLSLLREHNPALRVVWDPVAAASTGYAFRTRPLLHALPELMRACDVVTPNVLEVHELCDGAADGERQCVTWARSCSIILKGGHDDMSKPLKDTLFAHADAQPTVPQYFVHDRIVGNGKHGSGCVFSSSIAAALFSGKSLSDAVPYAQHIVREYLKSGVGRVGFLYRLPGESERECR